jgi:molybdate transport system substrate-binding protein
MLRLLALFLVALPVFAAEVRVFAAASLTDALHEIARAYQRTSPDRIVFNLGASSTLARQIQEGAPADLFLSADEAKMNALAKRGLVAARASVLSNTLVIVVPREGGRSITGPRQLAQVSSLALAEPSSVPAGIYAKQYLVAQKVWAQLAAKVIPTDNVRAALAAVESGNVDAAIVYKTDALISKKKVRVAYEVPRHAGPRISYAFAVLKDADQPVAAQRFFAYLQSKAALAVFAKYGF